VVVNKGDAGGTIGDIGVASARPDGYTIGLTPNNPITAQPHIQKLPYDMASFRYVCLAYDVPYVLMASLRAPFKTFAEFMAFAKAKNDNLIYASPGPGTQPHLDPTYKTTHACLTIFFRTIVSTCPSLLPPHRLMS
jgi:tripartite-type tricarboxylate transporter receptor subunit TctC